MSSFGEEDEVFQRLAICPLNKQELLIPKDFLCVMSKSKRAKAHFILISVPIQTMKVWPIDPRGFKQEVSEKLPQGL